MTGPPHPPAISIRPIEPGEHGAVCALVARVFDAFVAPEFPPQGVEEFRSYAQPDAMAQRGQAGYRVLVAEEDRRIVGMLELRGSEHIAMLFVETRGRGVGRSLVERALAMCAEGARGAGRVTVHASRYAAPIYRKLGFEAEGPERTKNGITYLPMAFRFQAGG